MMNDIKDTDIIEEYKNYVLRNVFSNSFDFDTWCQHQYGKSLNDFTVKPNLSFDVLQEKNIHK